MASPAAVLSVLVTANTTQATRGLMRFNTTLGATESSANKALGAIKTMAKGTAIGVGVGLGYAVKKAADFEQQMDSLGSVSGATGREMERFRKQAMKAGADTKFSALDAAKAQTELAKGGASVAQIAKGGLKSALALAAAGELDLALAAETSANAMNLFGLEGKQAMKVADMLATAANATTADVEDFSMALKMGGSVAKMAGLSFGETVLALEALAKIGIRNSDAGTSLKTALIQLLKPTAKQAELAHKLNLEFVDQHGNFKDLADISEMLRDKLGGMTAAQRTAALATLAGTDGVRTLSALYDAGPAKLDKWAKGLGKAGTAAKVAAEKQDNLKGKLENLQGSIETAAIALGTKMLPALTKAAEKVTDIINDPKLSGSEKLNKLAKMAGDAFSKGLSIAADKAAQIAPKVANAFVNGFLNADAWGRLAIGAFLFSKLGGVGALAKTGTAAGAAAGTGFLGGMRGKLAGKGGLVGLAALFGAVVGPDLVKVFTEHGDASKYAGKEFEFAAERMERLQRAGNMTGLNKAAADAKITAKSLGESGGPLRRLAQHYDDLADAAIDTGKRIQHMGATSSDSVANLRKQVGYNTQLIKEKLGKDTKAGKDALTKNFLAAADNVRKSMGAGTISVKRGTHLIEVYMVRALESMGFTKADALALRSRGPGSKQTPLGGELRPNQRGSFINEGKPFGDSVPSLLERGEYVLNRNAVRKVGRRNLDQLNFMAAPRFQKGGMAGMISAANKLDQAHFPYVWGGGHSGSPAPFGPMDCSGAVSFVLQHGGVKIPTMVSGALMNAGKPGAGRVTVFANAGHTFMKIGNRFFGTSGSNPGGGAGWFPDPGASYRSNFVQRHFAGMGGPSTVPRVLVDGPNSMLKGVVQGSLDTTRAAANASLRQLLSTSIGSGDAGDAGPGFGKTALRRLWVRANDGLGDPNLMAAIALAESGGNPSAHNPSGASGLWQILGQIVPGNIFNPFVNARNAGAKLRSQGLRAWEAYTNGNYRQFLQRGGIAKLKKGGHPVGVTDPFSFIPGTIMEEDRKRRRRVKRYRSPSPYGKGTDILGSFLEGLQQRYEMRRVLAELDNVEGVPATYKDDIVVAREAVGAWTSWLNVAQLNHSVPGIITAATELRSAKDWLAELTRAPDTVVTDNESVDLLRTLLREANQRTAVSQSQYKALRDMPAYGGSFAQGGVIPGPIGAPRVVVAHGGETVTPPGVGGDVHLHFAPGTEWLKDFVKVTVGQETRRSARSASRGLPGRGGG